MFQSTNLRCIAALVVMTCAFLPARAAEVSAAERVETTPGLSPEVVRRVFDGKRQSLGSCLRLIEGTPAEGPTPYPYTYAPWTAPSDADDRILLRFTVDPDGKVANRVPHMSTMEVRGVFIDEGCAQEQARRWTFPSFAGKSPVEVSVWARFRTTEAERKATLARTHAGFAVLCKSITAAIPGDGLPSREVWLATLTRVVSEQGPGLDAGVQQVIDAVKQVNVEDASTIILNAMEQMASKEGCPKLRKWAAH